MWSEVTTGRAKSLPAQAGRSGHTAVVWGASMYVFGGDDSKESGLNDMWQHSFESLEWKEIEQKGSVPTTRSGHSAVAHGDSMYVFGGSVSVGKTRVLTNDLFAFHFETQTWKQLKPTGSAPEPREKHCAVVLGSGDAMAVIGGWNWQDSYKPIHVYNFVKNEWIRIDIDNSVERIWAAAVVRGVSNSGTRPEESSLSTKMSAITIEKGEEAKRKQGAESLTKESGAVWLFAGEDKDIILCSDMFCIAPDLSRWVAVGGDIMQHPADRYAHSMVYCPPLPTPTKDLHISSLPSSSSASSASSSASTSAVSAPSPNPNPTSVPASVPASIPATAAANDSLVVFGGYGGEMTLFNDAWQYSFEHNRWRVIAAKGTPPVPRHGHTSVLFNGSLYVFGGKLLDFSVRHDLHQLKLDTDVNWKSSTVKIPEAVHWSCLVCTFAENFDFSRTCGMCGADRPRDANPLLDNDGYPYHESPSRRPAPTLPLPSRNALLVNRSKDASVDREEDADRMSGDDDDGEDGDSDGEAMFGEHNLQGVAQAERQQPAQQDREWACASCTFQNKSGAVQCEMCYSPPPR